jgi:dTDP-4-amino-4,6-dideoxygalactose transaminase
VTNDYSLWERALLFSDVALPRAYNTYASLPYANYFLSPNYKMSELIAAVLVNQITKVDGYIARKIEVSQALNKAFEEIPEITPQVVREGNRHSYWNYGATIDTEALGVSAPRFAAMVSAEGVPFSGPYIGTPDVGPLYKNPFLREPALYGHSRFPLDYQRERRIDYRHVECPYGEALMSRGIMFQTRPFDTDEDIRDTIDAVTKVVEHCRSRSFAGAR